MSSIWIAIIITSAALGFMSRRKHRPFQKEVGLEERRSLAPKEYLRHMEQRLGVGSPNPDGLRKPLPCIAIPCIVSIVAGWASLFLGADEESSLLDEESSLLLVNAGVLA